MPIPRRHHFLPQSYQARWCVDGGFALLDRQRGKVRWASPPNTAVERDYYRIVFGSGAFDLGLEEFLSEVEARAKEAIDTLTARRRITGQQKAELALFVAFLASRGPRFMEAYDALAETRLRSLIRDRVPDEGSAAEWLSKHPDLPERLRTISPGKLLGHLHGTGYRIRVPPAYRIIACVRAAIETGPALATANWSLCHAEGGTVLLTTDSPVLVLPPAAAPPVPQLPEHVLPLSPTLLLRTGGPGSTITERPLGPDEAAWVNQLLQSEASRFIIATRRELLPTE